MKSEAERIAYLLMHAHTAEEVFGDLVGTRKEMFETVRSTFRHMAKALHPDTSHQRHHEEAFNQLMHFWRQAHVKIEQGTYGTVYAAKTFEPFSMRTSRHTYSVEGVFGWGDLCSLYAASMSDGDKQRRVLLKIPIKPQHNDLVANEARVLAHLQEVKEYTQYRHFVSRLVESFSYHERETGIVRQVNVLQYDEGFYTLKEVRAVYPQGIDPKDMAWMWRRLLVALGLAHDNTVIHGAVLPTHVLIHPQQHGLALIDWSYAVIDAQCTGAIISAISSAYRDWYPSEVFAKKVPTPGLDIAMAARCMIDLLGGEARNRTLPATVPWPLRNHLLGCTLAAPQMRVQDVHLVLAQFDDLIERLWGPRAFREFRVPERQPSS